MERSKPAKDFESALKRLEQIVADMERGEMHLDCLLKEFEEGMRLATFCSKSLEEAEKKVQMLMKEADGSFRKVPFEAERAEPGDETPDEKSAPPSRPKRRGGRRSATEREEPE